VVDLATAVAVTAQAATVLVVPEIALAIAKVDPVLRARVPKRPRSGFP